jgi:hypothetical protein
MSRFQNPFIGQMTYVVHFRQPQEKIRFSQGGAEVAFRSFGADQSQQTNLPDNADPSLARLVFVDDRRSIAISQVAIQYAHTFEPHGNVELGEHFVEIRREIADFHRQVLEYKPSDEYSHVAAVLQVNYPSTESTRFLHQYVYERFVTFKPIGDIASFQMTLGFKVNDLFVNLGASVYETRQIDPRDSKQGRVTPISIMLNMEESKVIARGVQLTIDVNDRPRHSRNRPIGAGSLNDVLDTASKIIEEQLPGMVNE